MISGGTGGKKVSEAVRKTAVILQNGSQESFGSKFTISYKSNAS